MVNKHKNGNNVFQLDKYSWRQFVKNQNSQGGKTPRFEIQQQLQHMMKNYNLSNQQQNKRNQKRKGTHNDKTKRTQRLLVQEVKSPSKK